MTLNANWVGQVLRDRGVNAPGHGAIGRYLQALDPRQLAIASRIVREIQFGTEQASDLDLLLKGIESVPPNALVDSTCESKQINRAEPVPSRPAAGKILAASLVPLLRRHSEHMYSAKAAMKVELDVLRRAGEDGSPVYTVLVEMAPVIARGSYDWKRKLPFQMTKREIPLLAATLLGYTVAPLRLGNHGPAADKFFDISNQGKVMYAKMRQGARQLSMPVPGPDVHAWAQICLVALQLNAPELDASAHLALLQRAGRMHDATAEAHD